MQRIFLLFTAASTLATAAMADPDSRGDGHGRADRPRGEHVDSRPSQPAPIAPPAPPRPQGGPAGTVPPVRPPAVADTFRGQPSGPRPTYDRPVGNPGGQTPPIPSRADGGRPDGGRSDSGRPDPGRQNWSRPDWGNKDWGNKDGGRQDGNRQDWGRPDWSHPDNNRPDERWRGDRDHGSEGRGRDGVRIWEGGDRGRDRDGDHRWHYRGQDHDSFRIAPYRYPRGWGYRTWALGERLPLFFLTTSYFIDFYDYDLPPPAYGCRWVRYGPDALLVDLYTGEVRDVIYGVFYW